MLDVFAEYAELDGIDDEDDTIEIEEVIPHSLSNKDMAIPDAPSDDASDDDEEDEDDEDDNEREMSMSESMSAPKDLSNIPRASFRQISYKLNDNINPKTFKKYKSMRGKFAVRYKKSRQKTMDLELNKRHSQFYINSLSSKTNILG